MSEAPKLPFRYSRTRRHSDQRRDPQAERDWKAGLCQTFSLLRQRRQCNRGFNGHILSLLGSVHILFRLNLVFDPETQVMDRSPPPSTKMGRLLIMLPLLKLVSESQSTRDRPATTMQFWLAAIGIRRSVIFFSRSTRAKLSMSQAVRQVRRI